MTRKTLSPVEKAHWEATDRGHVDARDSLSTCPLMGQKVQLLPLRYGRVERLKSPTDTDAYEMLQRPVGLRLLRDGYLYVIDETNGYLHEYEIHNGVPVKLLWQDREVGKDVRQTSTGETTLVFGRNSVLYVAYAELQWTAAKCTHVLGSAEDRRHFMQRVSLAEVDCLQGGVHLRVENQIRAQLAELAEQPAPQCASPDIPAEELQDYSWESEPLFREAHIGELKSAINPYYERNHLYLVVQDSIGILRDLAEEQDVVVSWIEQWRNRTDNDLRYPVASYIDTLIKVGDHTARQADGGSRLIEKTTPEQRTRIYDYVDARNTWRLHRNQGPVPVVPVPGQPQPLPSDSYEDSPATKVAKQEMERRKTLMIEALGEPLHDELEDDIQTLESHSTGTMEGIGLGSRGVHDLVRVEEMQRYLARERAHLKRWTARLDAITADRISLFEDGEFHRSAWYFDPEHPDQLRNALAMEFNCMRDIARTEAGMERLGEYFHNNPHFILPVFYGRLNMSYLQGKVGDLFKWLDDFKNFPQGLVDAQRRISEVTHILGHHWTNSFNLTPEAHAAHQAVNATYIPSIALRMEQWFREMHELLNSPDLRRHLNTFSHFTNRAQRLGMLVALQVEGATLSIANQDDIDNFKAQLARLNQLLFKEDQLLDDRNRVSKDLTRGGYGPHQRQAMIDNRQAINQMLLTIRNSRSVLRRQIEAALTPTSGSPAGYVGVRLNLTPQQQAAFDDEIKRFKAGMWKGYGTQGSQWAGVKGGMLPLLAMALTVSNVGEAWETWREAGDKRNFKELTVALGVFGSFTSAALSVYQGVHIAMIDHVLRSVASTPSSNGRLFTVKQGKLGLGLGAVISSLATIGAIGTAWNNWEKWQDTFISGTAGEKAGALLGLIGDAGTLGTSSLQTAAAGTELVGLLREVLAAPSYSKQIVANQAWATRGARFLNVSARLMPIGLIFTALQLTGETVYNYFHLDDQQRWLLGSIWGTRPQGWNWDTHAQILAEASLLPTVQDRGIHRASALSEPIRILHLTLPGLTAATFNDTSLRWAAAHQDGAVKQDVGGALSQLIIVASASPLTLELRIPTDWLGHHSVLHLQLAVRPTMAKKFLKEDKNYLHYQIPLTLDALSKTISPLKEYPKEQIESSFTSITRERINEST